MAYWQRQKGKVRVFSYSATHKKAVLLPRSEVAHLDDLHDREVDDWVKRWERLHEVGKKRPRLVAPRAPGALESVERFLAFTSEVEALHPATTAKHRHNLITIAFPFFCTVREAKALDDFRPHSKDLMAWLLGEGLSAGKVRCVQQSLGKFWRWCREEALVDGDLLLRSPREGSRRTPLPHPVTPDEVLAWASTCTRSDICLFGLLSYFFSLRPQETVALQRSDFAAGEKARSTEAAKALLKARLWGGLVVRVERQFSKKVGITPPKSHSVGVVACFTRKGAKAVYEALKAYRSKDPSKLFPMHVDAYYHRWPEHGMPGITLKDLRRASIYWLANHTDLPIGAIRNHARHSSIETTGLYSRRPTEPGFNN